MRVHGILERAAELATSGEPFALVTVTWRRGPSSGKGGSKALIHPDGQVEGWLGGACAEPTVVRLALEALSDATPRLLVLGEEDGREGVAEVAMACASEGAMEVYVEPILPSPDVWIVGRSPAVDTLAELAGVLGWRAHLVSEDLDLSGVGARSFVVVATQGHFDEPAVEAALASPASYIGVVASEKRASLVKEWLVERGVSPESIARLHAPCGLDLGPTEHHEIAVSVLAELVAFKAAGAGAQTVDVKLPAQATDPVCGMSVDIAAATFVSEHRGEQVYFCAAGCQRAFDRDPEAFASR